MKVGELSEWSSFCGAARSEAISVRSHHESSGREVEIGRLGSPLIVWSTEVDAQFWWWKKLVLRVVDELSAGWCRSSHFYDSSLNVRLVKRRAGLLA